MLKSLIVAAPAGSGKTEELSRRYIELLKDGVEPERILTLTFTEKAAAEMKERILRRLRENHPELYQKVRDNILRLRISTFHSFCLGLLQRFAPHVGLDPALEALDETGADALWGRAMYDTLARIAAEPRTRDYRTLMDLVTPGKTQAWGKLTEQFAVLYGKRVAVEHARLAPVAVEDFHALRSELLASSVGRGRIPDYSRLFPEFPSPDAVCCVLSQLEKCRSTFLNPGGGPIRKRGTPEEVIEWNRQMSRYRNVLVTLQHYEAFGRMLDLFRRRFLTAYDGCKREAGTVDFVDMEHRALKIISEDDQWQNILYAFDEQTDHLLVDEFQDTSYLQWAIVHRLVEEWLSGEGAKTDRAIEPSIFIVGDVKQSIYLFRDAKVEVFSEARGELRAAPGASLEEKPMKYNYRSLQAIIDFTNALFSRLMGPTNQTPPDPWRTPYEPFERGRKNDAPGRVEILLDRSDDNMPQRREIEAGLVARRIQSLVSGSSPLRVYDRRNDGEETPRPCEYGDIAILMRKRTHLGILTDALHRNHIPFVTVGGEGFYSEPEVCHLRSLLAFLIDPSDGYSLYALLRGPLFSLPERDLLLANSGPGRTFWERLQAYAQKGRARDTDELPDSPSRVSSAASAATALHDWLGRVNRQPLAAILEGALSERQAWTLFWEDQRVANIRKFLRIVETMELEGRHPLRILEFLESGPDEKRADVSVETSKAVQIMTIHGAKGLQFPVVFYVGGDVGLRGKDDGNLLIEERGAEEAWVSFLPEVGLRKENAFHTEFRDKEWEEEKRVFYVACTRATDALFLTGVWYKNRRDTTIGWLEEYLGLREGGTGFRLESEVPGVHCLSAPDIPVSGSATPAKKPPRPPAFIAPLSPEPAPTIRAVTRNLPADFRSFGEESVGTGEVIHKLLEEISTGRLTADGPRFTAEIQRLLRLAGLNSSLSASIQSTVQCLMSDVRIASIITPQPISEAELPIMYSDGETIYTGRIDRITVTEDEVRIYDYKTFPVNKRDVQQLAREYHEAQLKHYARACELLYPGKLVSTHVVFTALPLVVRAG